MISELVAIDNTLMIIAGSLFWLAVAQTLFLCAVFIKLRQLVSLRENQRNNRQQESDSVKDRIEYHKH
jgi:hypothetical protein